MRGKRITDDEIKRFIQFKKERNKSTNQIIKDLRSKGCLLYTSPSPRDRQKSRMPSSA